MQKRPHHKFTKQPLVFKINPEFHPIDSLKRVVYRRHLEMEIGEDYVAFRVFDSYYDKAKPDKEREEVSYKQKEFVHGLNAEAKRLHYFILNKPSNINWEMKYVSDLFDEIAMGHYIMREYFPAYYERYGWE